MEEKDYWNRVSNEKEFTTPFQTAVFEEFVSKDALILDIGCGYGRTLDELWQAGYRNSIGMDFSEGMIDRGRVQYPNLDLRVMENDSTAMPAQSVDAVILFAVLTCIKENEKQTGLISEIHRILKPGGIVYVNDFLLNLDERNKKRYEEFHAKYGVYGIFELPEGAVCRHHDEAWIHQLLSGFSPLKQEHLTFTTMNGHRSEGFFYVGRENKESSKEDLTIELG